MLLPITAEDTFHLTMLSINAADQKHKDEVINIMNTMNNSMVSGNSAVNLAMDNDDNNMNAFVRPVMG